MRSKRGLVIVSSSASFGGKGTSTNDVATGRVWEHCAPTCKEPLGIIALFIVLVYGIAALVLGVSANELNSSERLPLIWFMVIFPVIVLIAFFRLVTHHHHKLYAPEDFPNPSDFLRTMTPREQAQRLDDEIRESGAGEQIDIGEAKAAEEAAEPTSRTRNTYVLSEELAFRELAAEFGVAVRRHVMLPSVGGVDGILLTPGRPIAVEVKVLSDEKYLDRMVTRAIDTFSTIHSADDISPDPSYLLVLVTHVLTDEAKMGAYERAFQLVQASPLNIDLRLYDFFLLLERYGVS